jgi:hypothetical protein
MNRKSVAFVLALVVCTSAFVGCSDKNNHSNVSLSSSTAKESEKYTATSSVSVISTTYEATDDASETATEITTSDTEQLFQKPLIETDDSAFVSINEDGSFNVVFEDSACTMTFPASWAGRIIIDDDEIYSKLCWDNAPGEKHGKLLSIMTRDDDEMNISIPSSYILGTEDDEYVIAFIPTDATYDIMNSTLNEEYSSLCADILSVISSAECQSSPGFTHIDMKDYDSPNMYSISVSGSWEASSYMNSSMQFTPYIGFRPNDGVFGYMYQLNGADTDKEIGTYLININSENYQWNTENWGEAGLIFMDGCIYSFTYYLSAPMTMSIEKLGGNSKYDSITSETWFYTSDFQDFDVDYNYD